MRVSTLFLAVFLATGAAGRGWRVAYEKGFLYYAWQIDLLNPESERTIGLMCAEVIDKSHGGCKDVSPRYKPCTAEDKTWDRTTRTHIITERPCRTLTDFLAHIDDIKWLKRTPIPGGQTAQSMSAPPVDETAAGLNRLGMDQNRHPPWRVIKDGTTFNKMIEDVGEVIVRKKASMTTSEYDTHRSLFTGAAYSLDRVRYFRYIDNRKNLIKHLEKEMEAGNMSKMELVKTPTGYKDYEGNDMVDLSVERTIDRNKDDIPDVRDQLERVLKEFYSTPEAVEHNIVINSVESARNRIMGTSCSTT